MPLSLKVGKEPSYNVQSKSLTMLASWVASVWGKELGRGQDVSLEALTPVSTGATFLLRRKFSHSLQVGSK